MTWTYRATLGIFRPGFIRFVLACIAAQPAPPVPAGAASGLNTFIYIYTET